MNNSITLIGHVGQKPKVLTFAASEKKLVKFSLAVKEFSSTNEERTLWIDVEAWNDMGKRVLDTITKGREVAIHGRLGLTSYIKSVDGKTVEVTKPIIKLTGFHLCGRKPEAKDAPVVESPIQKEGIKESKKVAAA